MVMHKMMYKIDTLHLYIRDGVYYFVTRIPVDIRSYYSSNRISMSLKTKSLATANRAIKSINQSSCCNSIIHVFQGVNCSNKDLESSN